MECMILGIYVVLAAGFIPILKETKILKYLNSAITLLACIFIFMGKVINKELEILLLCTTVVIYIMILVNIYLIAKIVNKKL